MAGTQDIGLELFGLASELFPICRSISGDGVRQTLDILGRHIPITRHELPTGTSVLDWRVPKEWNISDAYIATPDGRRIIDFRRNNLHVVNYSAPVRGRVPLAELKSRIKTLPEMPDAIDQQQQHERDCGQQQREGRQSTLHHSGGEAQAPGRDLFLPSQNCRTLSHSRPHGTALSQRVQGGDPQRRSRVRRRAQT